MVECILVSAPIALRIIWISVYKLSVDRCARHLNQYTDYESKTETEGHKCHEKEDGVETACPDAPLGVKFPKNHENAVAKVGTVAQSREGDPERVR